MKYLTQAASILKIALLVAALATASGQAQAQGQSGDIIQDSVKDLTTVAVMGGTGALLGLSTLSFVDEPKDHLKNVLVGGALGIIIGVGFVAFNQANQSKQVIKGVMAPSYKEMPTVERVQWHQASLSEGTSAPRFVKNQDEATPMNVTFSF